MIKGFSMKDTSTIDHIKKFLGIRIIYKISCFFELFLKSFGLGFNIPNKSYEKLGHNELLFIMKRSRTMI
jgi:dolichyl-phosphate-mannose--protein O-mannosyl transferase